MMTVEQALDRGEAWYREHRDHVRRLLKNAFDSRNPAAVKPTGSDLIRPELWKTIHWRWFLEQRPQK